MSRIAELLEACDRGDEVRIEQLGWRPVLDALRFWPRRVGGAELAPYVTLLGDQDPDAVAAAITTLAGEERWSSWRPAPVEIFQAMGGGRLHVPHPTDDRVRRGESVQPRPDTTDRAMEAVRAALAAGEIPCECTPRPVAVWIDDDGVIRCPHCNGLEPGQVDRVRDTPPEPVRLARRDLQRLAAEVQNERIMEGRDRSPLLDRLAGGTDTPWHIFKPLPPITEADRQREREILGWPEP